MAFLISSVLEPSLVGVLLFTLLASMLAAFPGIVVGSLVGLVMSAPPPETGKRSGSDQT